MRKETFIPRRKFIKGVALSTAGITILPRHILGGKGFIAPSDRVNIGIVGAGGQSMYSITQLLKLDDIRLTCIADPSNLWKNDILYRSDTGRGPTKKFIDDFYTQKGQGQKISEYLDFRLMLQKEKDLDAIVCATPDNTHAFVSITSMRAGKHVYCEKPLTHNIWEARRMAQVERETGRATQMGNQGHASDTIRQTVEYLQSGIIGPVKEAHSWVGANRWIPELMGLPKEISPLPEGVDWDLWLGPTSWHPYNKLYTPVKWRDFWAFGCGALGDFGCHDMDAAHWAFDLRHPETVQVYYAGKGNSSEIAPYAEIGYYHFAAHGNQPALKLTWYSGGLRPDRPDVLPPDITFAGRGAMFVGEKGIILTNGGSSGAPEIFPLSLRESFNPPAPYLPRARSHHREWIDAIKGGQAALSNFDYAANLTETTLLGVLSLRLGGRLINWDAKNMKATGIPEADNIIREPVRKGWEME